MARSIKNSEVDRLARELSDVTGETITEAIAHALKERLERETGKPKGKQLREDLLFIGEDFSKTDVKIA